MARIYLDQDIQPLSAFRANVSTYLKQLQETRRPLILTQHGKSVGVMLDVATFEAMQERMELLEDIHLAQKQLAAGEGKEHQAAKAELLGRLGLQCTH